MRTLFLKIFFCFLVIIVLVGTSLETSALLAEALGGHSNHVTATRNVTAHDRTALVSTAARALGARDAARLGLVARAARCARRRRTRRPIARG